MAWSLSASVSSADRVKYLTPRRQWAPFLPHPHGGVGVDRLKQEWAWVSLNFTSSSDSYFLFPFGAGLFPEGEL